MPSFCEIIEPANENAFGWAHRRALDNDYMTWRWLDTDYQHVLMAKQLSTGIEFEVLREDLPQRIDTPSIRGDLIVFSREEDSLFPYERELYGISVTGGAENQLTDNSTADGYPETGTLSVVYEFQVNVDAGSLIGLAHLNTTSGVESVITQSS